MTFNGCALRSELWSTYKSLGLFNELLNSRRLIRSDVCAFQLSAVYHRGELCRATWPSGTWRWRPTTSGCWPETTPPSAGERPLWSLWVSLGFPLRRHSDLFPYVSFYAPPPSFCTYFSPFTFNFPLIFPPYAFSFSFSPFLFSFFSPLPLKWPILPLPLVIYVSKISVPYVTVEAA